VLQVLPISLLGAVVGLVMCVITRTNNKCSQWHEPSAVPKSKRKDGTPQRLLGRCVVVLIQAPQAFFFFNPVARGLLVVMLMAKSWAPCLLFCRLKRWLCSAI
jgi:hypothetical protein